MRKTIMFMVTSTADLGDTGAKTGIWLEEIAAPYATFCDAGYNIVIASTAGGAAPLDPASLEKPWLTLDGERFLASPDAQRKLRDTLPVDTANAAEIDALFVVGGTGTLWDFPHSAPLAHLIETLLARRAPVALVCHGVAALMNARTPDGAPIARGRSLTCFSNAEERMLEFDGIVPFLVESALVDQGADFTAAAPFDPHVVEDGLLLTGQNPASAKPLAVALDKAMKLSA